VGGLTTGELHIGTLYSLSVGVVPTALKVWRGQFPEVQAHLVEFRHSDDLAAAMEAGQADLAVGPAPEGWAGPARVIGTEEFVIVASATADLPPEPTRVRVADLADREWVHFTAKSGLSYFLDQLCATAGFAPHVAVRTEQGPSAVALARAGLGLALVPSNIIPPHFDGIILRTDPPVLRVLSVYTRVRPDPITAAFVDAIADDTPATPPHIRRRLGSA
jgi:DNA-binding transcriptional LysR family regulator